MPRLKEHLLPRVLSMLKVETNQPTSPETTQQNPTSDPINFLFFKSERMYAHRTIRFNYTTYDVRRAQDVVNPRTTHCNIMLLDKHADSSDDSAIHPYVYARVIGIFHVNVVYTGPGMVNYNPTRFDFLWVRWYEHIPTTSPYRLDQLTFPPMAEGDAFGFVNPTDVLRSCHIIPAFSQGTCREPGEAGLSDCARDIDDSKVYYVGR